MSAGPAQNVAQVLNRAPPLGSRGDAEISSSSKSPPPVVREEPALSWTVHPAAADPLKAALLVGVLTIASVLCFEFSGSAILGVLAFLMLALSLRSWFLPRRYTLDAAGAREDGPLCAARLLLWQEVRKVSSARFGVYLSTLHSRSRFVRDTGLFLRTASQRPDPARPPCSRDAVLTFADRAVEGT